MGRFSLTAGRTVGKIEKTEDLPPKGTMKLSKLFYVLEIIRTAEIGLNDAY